MNNIFNRSKHIYQPDAFEEIVKDTIRFFNGTPVHTLPPPESFIGTGVYALYYTGESPYYQALYDLNRIEFKQPIYVGKAVPKGWRQARKAKSSKDSYELYRRLCDHTKSIEQANNLNLEDFHCRFMILENAARDLIGSVEAALIRYYTPVWNSSIDGFGNHDPGRGRYNQAKSEWDILHPGRRWAYKCQGGSSALHSVGNKVREYLTRKQDD